MNRRMTRAGRTVLLAIAVAALVGCSSSAPPVADTPPPPVTVSKPIITDVVEFDEYEGHIVAYQKEDVKAQVKGYLDKIAFEPGQEVKEGDLLYEIDPRVYQAGLGGAKAQEKAAQANLTFTKSELERTRYLVSKAGASRQDLDVWTAKQLVAEAEVKKAEEAVKKAQLDVDFTKLTAKISGKMGRTLVDKGNLINGSGAETLLTTIVSIDPIYVSFNVDERALIRYRKSKSKDRDPKAPEPHVKDLHIPVEVALDGDRGFPHKGEIVFADNKINPSTGTIEIRGNLPNKLRKLDDGMRTRVRVPISKSSNSLLITERAIGSDQGKKFVFVVGSDDVALRRDITTGRLADNLIVVTEGLKADDLVVVNGIQRVRDGMKVKPRTEVMPGAVQRESSTSKESAK